MQNVKLEEIRKTIIEATHKVLARQLRNENKIESTTKKLSEHTNLMITSMKENTNNQEKIISPEEETINKMEDGNQEMKQIINDQSKKMLNRELKSLE
jgi:DNA-binding HxlR family transcriptional regulator